MTDRLQRPVFAALLLVLLVFAGWVYWPGQSGPALLDDTTSVRVIGDLKANPEQALDYVFGDRSGPLGRPISITSFVLERLLLEEGLATSKRVNILLHVFNGFLVTCLLGLLFRQIGTPAYRWLALVLGISWLLAPLYVSTVLYVVQRMAMLATTFMLLSCLAYVHWREQLSRGRFSVTWLVLVGLCALLALFSKENAAVLVPALLLMEALWFQFLDDQGRPIGWLRRLTLGLSALMAVVAFGVLVFNYDGLAADFHRRHFTLDERLLTQSRILWDYVAQQYLPDVFRMGLYHDDVTLSTSLFEPVSTFYAVMAWCGVVLLCSLLLLRRWGRYLVFGMAWYLVGHSIESSVLPLELYFEHRNYFPGIGLFLLVGTLLAAVLRCWPQTAAPLLACVACYTVWTASLTVSQVQIWSSHPLLILNNVNAHPNSYRANADMAVQMARLGQVEEARAYSTRAFEVSVAGERSGDRDVRDLALACIAGESVTAGQFEHLGGDNPKRPFGSVVTLQTLVLMLQEDACPDFDRLAFADRMARIYLAESAVASASGNIYLGLAVLENNLERWQNAEAYIDRYFTYFPGNAQGLLMKLHFTRALGKVAEAEETIAKLQAMQRIGRLTVGEQQTLSLYLEN